METDLCAWSLGEDAVQKLLVDAISIRGEASTIRLQTLSVEKLEQHELEKLSRGVREMLMDIENHVDD